MKRFLSCLVFPFILGAFSWAQEADNEPEGFTFILGPRVGYSYAFMDEAAFSRLVTEVFPAGDYSPATTIFGVSLEQRVLLGQTKSHFAFQELLAVHGLEQSIALPVVVGMIGYRDASGFEAGLGPMLSFNGISVLVALGYTFSFKGVYIPVDLSFSLPNSRSPTLAALTTGFNFVITKRKGP